MKEKDVQKALNDSGFFAELSPAEKLHVLVEDIKLNGNVKKKNYMIWLDTTDAPQITQEERLDEVISVLEMPAPAATLQELQRLGFLKFCMGSAYYSMKVLDKKTYYKIIDNFDKCDDPDPVMRMTLFMFPFDPEHSRETLLEGQLEPETVDWMIRASSKYLDFKALKNEVSLKRFIATYGLEFYYFMDDFATILLKVTGMKNEYGRLSSRQYVDRWVRHHHPLSVEDLNVTVEDLKEIGFEEEDTGIVLQNLLEHCFKSPEDNSRERLLELAEKPNPVSRILSRFRR